MPKKDKAIRLQKYLSECGVASRRKSEDLIVEGKVQVNGKAVTELGTKIDPKKDRVKVGGKLILGGKKGVVILNKPRGVVTTKSDPEGRETVIDLLPKKFQSYFPVGRLDYDSSGLVVLTNDGELANRLSHPRYGILRSYHVRVEGKIEPKILEQIERGVKLPDGPVSGEAKIRKGDKKSTWLQITLTVGRNRIIRRLMDHLGHPVIKLKRVSHGPVKLGRLRVGEYEALTNADYQGLKRAIFG